MIVRVNGKEIETTPEHPFYVRDAGWTDGGDLKAGDELLGTNDCWTPIDAITLTANEQTVYNIHVSNDHTYFVGDADWNFSVWVHNTHGGAYRALHPEDVVAMNAGHRIMPKSKGGDILDHIQGRDSKYLSISMTKNGTAKYNGSHGIVHIDLDKALKTGSGFVPHKNVLQVAKRQGYYAKT